MIQKILSYMSVIEIVQRSAKYKKPIAEKNYRYASLFFLSSKQRNCNVLHFTNSSSLVIDNHGGS